MGEMGGGSNKGKVGGEGGKGWSTLTKSWVALRPFLACNLSRRHLNGKFLIARYQIGGRGGAELIGADGKGRIIIHSHLWLGSFL